MYELIITEKPAAAKKVAEALGKPEQKKQGKVSYYKVMHEGKEIYVGSAVGHLFGLAEKKKKGFSYPVFDIEWKPTYETSKVASYTKPYFTVLKKLAKKAKTVTVACDYDVEGEVIGLNVVRFICNLDDARRMKFSTLTKNDLVAAYSKAESHLDWGQANAGETRHYLDYYYGINLSRALTTSIKRAGMFKILSTGRVQAPALKIIVDREKEIMAFNPEPFWQVELDGEAKSLPLTAWHETGKFWDEKEVKEVMKRLKGVKEAEVGEVKRDRYEQKTLVPFDLTSLQSESYRNFHISPKQTLEIAQDLYINGFISYPRTSSQQLPESIGYATILKALSKHKAYKELAKEILKTSLKPRNGKKTDPAHPAIYPTGNAPKLDGRHAKVYDLIVKRFLTTFAPSAMRETMTLKLLANDEPFIAKGTRTVEEGWHRYYSPYVKLEEAELPDVKKKDKVSVNKFTKHDKQTQPPKRYTPSSIIKELEKRDLGTKATRADIVATLVDRHYVIGESLTATDLGIHICEILENYCPKIVDEELTRHFELDMDAIREKKLDKDKVLAEAQKVILSILEDFKKHDKEIGEGLLKTFTETRAALTTVGPCPVCKEGNLVVKSGKYGRFIACDRYPECTATYKLPASGKVEVSDKICDVCQHPKVKMIRKAKRPQEVCINPDCPAKQLEDVELGKCPKCKEGELVVRKSIYGQFVACGRFPKCRYTKR